ncbi:MAG: thiamine phosphate synthase [Syntrophobacterales bacterium]|nr:thiamine phosphate synthase [Syntrophobacterales bacterium]
MAMKAAHRKTGKPTLKDYRLYFVTDPRLNKGYNVLEQVDLALQGGVRIIQLREKGLPAQEFIGLASQALKLTRAYDAFLIINDLPEVASSVGADGVHIGQNDINPLEARKMLGKDAIIGLSVKTVEEAIRGEEDGIDYVAVSGVFPTTTKEDVGYYPGLEGIMRIRNCTRLPVIGIGGITRDNCRYVIDAGAHGVAVVTAITMSDNIPSACRLLLEEIGA